MLDAGIASLGQAEVAAALQIFFNLGTLKPAGWAVVNEHARIASIALRAALDARQLASLATTTQQLRAPRGAQAGAQRIQEALWAALDTAMAGMHDAALAVWHIHRVISKKRDPLKLTLFAHVIQGEGEGTLLDHFWKLVADALDAATQHAVSKGGAVRDVLTHAFPRLFALFEGALDRIARDSEVPSVLTAVLPKHRAALCKALAPFQEAFLAGSLARTREAVNTLFPSSTRSPPTAVAVQQFIGALHEELKVASKSAELTALVAVTVGKGLALLSARAGQLVASGAELRMRGLGAATPAQLRSITVSSQLFEVQRACIMLLPKLPVAAVEVLREPLQHVQTQAAEAVLPLFKAVAAEAEQCILEMHDAAPSSSSSSSAIVGTSAYVQRLASLLTRFRSDVLKHFSPPPLPSVPSVASLLCQRLASRLLTLFVRHAALLKPLDQQRKLQLAKDMSELEAVLRQAIYPPDLLRDAHAVLKGFRTLLFADDASLASADVQASVPDITLLLHCFSRLPESVPHPHVRTAVTPKQYSQWMDKHSAREVQQSIASVPLELVKHPVAEIMVNVFAR